ncbi:TerL [Listeria phage P35]|uniref:terminase large subunit n=1 Tax=Listeria phage P35 TaxID=330398 RepID=UPI00015C01EE|nr:terminase large subunit [Listeria phage P35]AAY53187.1 TerL [Listeria phage P35]
MEYIDPTFGAVDTDTLSIDINIFDLMSPAFHNIYQRVLDNTAPSHVWMKGGRGSGKSSFVALMVVDEIMKDPQANAVIFRKVDEGMRTTLLPQYQWAIDQLGVSGAWRTSLQPMMLLYKNPETGLEQQIRFKGVKDPKRVKASKFRVGYAKYLIYEEADEYESEEDFSIVNSSYMRGEGTGDSRAFYLYNPPKYKGHWLNNWVDVIRDEPSQYVHHSTFIPIALHHPEWLGSTWLESARLVRDKNPNRYEWEFLGRNVNTGNEVFPNAVQEHITFDMIDGLRPYEGFDEGYTADPSVWLRVFYDEQRDTVYITDELVMKRYKTKALAKDILNVQEGSYNIVRGDSANPRVLDEMRDLGVNALAVSKSPNSVPHGTNWLANRIKIVIDFKCPNTWREFSSYALLPDGVGNRKHGFPDKDNHTIDTTRYALEEVIANYDWIL